MATENNQPPEIDSSSKTEVKADVTEIKLPLENTTKSITITKSVIKEFLDIKKKMLSVVEMLIVAGLIVTSNLWLHNLSYIAASIKDWKFDGIGDALGATILLVMVSVFGLETRYAVIQKEKSKSAEDSNTEIQDMLQAFLNSGIEKIKNEVVESVKKIKKE